MCEERLHLIAVPCLRFGASHLREIYGVGRVPAQGLSAYSVSECLVQRACDVPHRLGGEATGAVLACASVSELDDDDELGDDDELDEDDELDDASPTIDGLRGINPLAKGVLKALQAGEFGLSTVLYVHGDSLANVSIYRLLAMVPGVGDSGAFRIGQSMRIKASMRVKDLTDEQKQEAYGLIRSHLGDR